MTDFSIKQNDTRPAIEVQLVDSLHDPRLLDNATEVRFYMEDVDTGSTVVDQPATIINEDEGRVTYAWQDGDTETAGRYEAEFEVTYTDGNVETFPNNGYIEVYIDDDVA